MQCIQHYPIRIFCNQRGCALYHLRTAPFAGLLEQFIETAQGCNLVFAGAAIRKPQQAFPVGVFELDKL